MIQFGRIKFLVVELCRALQIPVPALEVVPVPRRSSRWLAECAVRVLPVMERARYREEFEAELLELAKGRWQMYHAIRLVLRAVPLRLELRPARERVR